MTPSIIFFCLPVLGIALSSCKQKPAAEWVDPNPEFQSIYQNATRIEIVRRTADRTSTDWIENVVTVDDISDVRSFFKAVVLQSFEADTITVTYSPAGPVIRPFQGDRPLPEFGIVGGDGGLRGKEFRGDVYFTSGSRIAVINYLERHSPPTNKEAEQDVHGNTH
jgi:hypothetical protein